ncbi:MAG: glycine cleavage system protein H [Thermodesulforhabdaceae bacterium]
MKPKKRTRQVVFGIQEQQCIWMKAGVVNFKLCQNAYDCTTCSFDKAMQKAIREGDALESWREEMLRNAPEKLCRYAISGNVGARVCSYAYECSRCEFDQEMYERQLTEFPGVVKILMVGGFGLAVDYFYHPGHSWARMEYGGLVRVGMDDFAWRLMGFLDEIRLPEIGMQITASNKGWVVRREEKISPILSPVSGTVVARNYKTILDPDRAKDDPYGEGWLLMVEPDDLRLIPESLLYREDAESWLKAEVRELDAIAEELYGMALAATGGERPDDIYGNLKSVGWDRLIEKFLIRKKGIL